jgi:hypothetical protein
MDPKVCSIRLGFLGLALAPCMAGLFETAIGRDDRAETAVQACRAALPDRTLSTSAQVLLTRASAIHAIGTRELSTGLV